MDNKEIYGILTIAYFMGEGAMMAMAVLSFQNSLNAVNVICLESKLMLGRYATYVGADLTRNLKIFRQVG